MNLREPKTQRILIGVIGVLAITYIYFATSFLPFNYPVRKAKIEGLEIEHTRLGAELEKARQMVGNLARLGRMERVRLDDLVNTQCRQARGYIAQARGEHQCQRSVEPSCEAGIGRKQRLQVLLGNDVDRDVFFGSHVG